jgi:hypothetical protein
MRFQRSIKLFPGLRLNLSKSGLGISAGVRGLRLGVDSKGRSYVNAGIPGTGLSVRKYAKTVAAPHVIPPLLPSPQPKATLAPSAESSGNGSKGIWVLLVAGVLVIGAVLTISERPEHLPAVPVMTPEQKAIDIARQELVRSHPELTSLNITPDGPYPTKTIAGGFEVRLHCLREVGGFLPFVCQVQGLVAKCAAPPAQRGARKVGSPIQSNRTKLSNGLAAGRPVTGSLTQVGSRGGVYHYSKSGKKVYERKRR